MTKNTPLSRRQLAALSRLRPVSQATLARHWTVDPDTARRVLRAAKLLPVPSPHKTARYAWPDIWRFEGVAQDDILSPERHEDLMEPLLPAAYLARKAECTQATIRNWTHNGSLPSIRIGGSYRYRRSAISWLSDALEDGVEAETADPRHDGGTSKKEA